MPHLCIGVVLSDLHQQFLVTKKRKGKDKPMCIYTSHDRL